MVKKIIVLAVAFVLMLSAPLYNVIANPPAAPSPVNFGAGTGTAEVIESPEQLKALIESIPDVNTYLSTENITTVDPDFKSFTMIEAGTNSTTDVSYSYVDNGWKATEVAREHELGMYFTETALYYHAVGEMTTTDTVYSGSYADGYSNSTDRFLKADKTVMLYDIEIYYSYKLIMVRFNEYTLENLAKTDYNGTWRAVEEEVTPGEPSQQQVLDAFSKCYGKWMKLEIVEGDSMEAFFAMKGVTEEEAAAMGPEEQMDFMYEYYAYETANQISQMYIDSINQANTANVAYIANLTDFLISNIDTAFELTNNSYELKDESDAQALYLAVFGVTADENIAVDYADASVGVNTDVVVVEQNIELSYNSGKQSVEFNTETTFENVGNTVVSLKNQNVKSMFDTIKAPFKQLFKDIMESQGDN